MATLMKHQHAAIPSLITACKDVPAELDAVFRRMLAKAPADRFQTMADVVRALEVVAAKLGEDRPGGTIVLPSPESVLPMSSPASAPTGEWKSLDTGVDSSPAAPAPTIEVKLSARHPASL